MAASGDDSVVERRPYTERELTGPLITSNIVGLPKKRGKKPLFKLNSRRITAHKEMVRLKEELTQHYEDGTDAGDTEELYCLQKIIYEELCRETQQVPEPFPGVEEIAEEVSSR